jgi:hypothetical protein
LTATEALSCISDSDKPKSLKWQLKFDGLQQLQTFEMAQMLKLNKPGVHVQTVKLPHSTLVAGHK